MLKSVRTEADGGGHEGDGCRTQCRIKVARGPWHIGLISAGPLRRGLATFATSTGHEKQWGQKYKLNRGGEEGIGWKF